MRFMAMRLKNILAKGYLVRWLNTRRIILTPNHTDTLLTLLSRGKRGCLTNRWPYRNYYRNEKRRDLQVFYPLPLRRLS